MRGLLLTQEFPPALSGGISMYYYHLCCHLDGAVSVLTPDGSSAAEFDASLPFAIHRRRIPIVPPSLMTRSPTRILRLPQVAYLAAAQWTLFTRYARRILREEPADVVLVGHLYLGPLGVRLRRESGARYGISLHGSELHRYMGWRAVRRSMLGALDAADFLVVNSEFTRRQYLERGVRADQRFLKINPGVDTSRFRPDAGDPVQIRRQHGLGDRPLLLSVARLVEWKGQDTVLEALRRLRESVPDVVYLIVGEGPHRPNLERLVKELGLERHVVFAGFVPSNELPSYYRAADVMVVASREFGAGQPAEGFGIVYVEAAACGTPTIGGLGGGTEESIDDGVTGFRVDPSDAQAIADAALRLLEDRELARRFGRAGSERAVRQFDWSIQAGRLRAFLEKV
ncbi:MAG: glycosyltransferase family 4 protein [Gemmatimonadota bacterium]|nr:MAG: glycosyltransferase family 4 protein [Gemmatimonadota bacterium]